MIHNTIPIKYPCKECGRRVTIHPYKPQAQLKICSKCYNKKQEQEAEEYHQKIQQQL